MSLNKLFIMYNLWYYDIESQFLITYQENVSYHINNTWSLQFLISVSIISLLHQCLPDSYLFIGS